MLTGSSDTICIRFEDYSFDLVKATEKSVGYDLRSPITTTLYPHTPVIIRTGVFVTLPPNVEAQIRSKSGLAASGISVLNSPGTIDPDYEGEIGVILCNHTNEERRVMVGTKIAQMVFNRVVRPNFVYTNIGNKKNKVVEANRVRGTGGFGSTGA